MFDRLLSVSSRIPFHALAISLTLTACTMPMANDTDSDDGDRDGDVSDDHQGSSGDQGGTVEDAGESCNQVLTCAVNCADDACANDCYAKGSSSAQQKFDALLVCLNESMCADAECAQAACGDQIAACVNDVEAPQNPNTPPVTEGMVPGELVGDWIGNNGSYHFDANGSYFFVGILSTSGNCIAFEKIEFTDSGVAAASGSTLTLTAENRKQVTYDCSGQPTTATQPPETKQYGWSIQGTTLTLVGDTGPIDYQRM